MCVCRLTLPALRGIKSTWQGFLILLGIASAGYIRTQMYDLRNNTNHLINCTEPITAYKAVAITDSQYKNYAVKATLELQAALIHEQWRPMQGKVQVRISGTGSHRISYGDVMVLMGQPKLVPGPANPHAFDYKQYLSQTRIYHEHALAASKIKKLDFQPPSHLKLHFLRARKHIAKVITRQVPSPAARGVILAMILGIRDELDSEIKKAYINTGTIHILAISGLHVGMLYWFLSMLLGFIGTATSWAWLGPLGSMCVLWWYAFLTELSPSVMRAVTMFSLATIARGIRRQQPIYHILTTSAFLLLWWDPLMLFRIGFQLSYLAVLGIVYLQPRIYSLMQPRHWLIRKIWSLGAVSLAAQLSTSIVSLYYFGFFPTYFWLANLLVVPAAFLILGLGFLVSLTGSWSYNNILCHLLGHCLTQVTDLTNWIVLTIQGLPCGRIGPIWLSSLEAILLCGLLLTLLCFLHYRKLSYLAWTTLLSLILGAQAAYDSFKQRSNRHIIFYSQKKKRTAIAWIKSRKAIMLVNERFKADENNRIHQIIPSHTAMRILSANYYLYPEVQEQQILPTRMHQGIKLILWEGKCVVIIDQKYTSPSPLKDRIQADILLIEHNSVKNLAPLLEAFAAKNLVIGGTNTPKATRLLQAQAEQHHIPYHLLKNKALQLDYNVH